jgi:Poxvirus A32 protein.
MSQSKDININSRNGRRDKLQIETFKFKDFVSDPAMVMIAKRGSGKSCVVKAILQFFRDIPVGLIISPTDRMSSFYGKFLPESYIFYKYDSVIIEKVLDRQRGIIDKQKRKEQEGKKIDPRCFVIMDDCLGQKGTWVRDAPILEMLFNGRHYKIMYILTMQYPLGITPELRSNFDYIFLLADDIISNQKRMYDHYAGVFPNFSAFREVFNQMTDDYGAMVIVNRGARKSFLEKIFYYKAPNPDIAITAKVTIGCEQFRDYDKNNYNKEWATASNKFNVDEYLAKRKKSGGKVVVEKMKDVELKTGPNITKQKKYYNEIIIFNGESSDQIVPKCLFICAFLCMSSAPTPNIHVSGGLNIDLNISDTYTGSFCSSANVRGIYLYIICVGLTTC